MQKIWETLYKTGSYKDRKMQMIVKWFKGGDCERTEAPATHVAFLVLR